ncbi:protein kinase domain-containing protein [Roseiconus lacunae]|uniref:protein kinase domain-containing protein n=1 Tax=Roseiconus lacunae TaxID=2605694 RepID=UPI001E505BE3|nr:protein kinase [Roseiconus lacunae]MCD0458260.1 protein kinase [Roseiconus lacunae]
MSSESEAESRDNGELDKSSDELVDAPSWYGEVEIRSVGDRFQVCLEGDWSGQLLGKRLGVYTLVELLGRGAMGLVFKGEAESGSVVAVKVLRPEISNRSSAIERFRKEARLLSEIDSPAITSIFEIGDERGLVYFVMEYVPGQSLLELLQRHGPLPPSRAIEVIRQIVSGLSHLHCKGIIHRDIKPSNVLVNLSDSEIATLYQPDCPEPLAPGAVKLSDLGLARFIRQTESMELTRTNTIIGTPRYLAPEQFSDRNDWTPASDVYSVGAMMFELITGRPPIQAESFLELAEKHAQQSLPSLRSIASEVDELVARLVDRALSKHPGHRFSDAAELLAEVDAIIEGQPTSCLLPSSGFATSNVTTRPLVFEVKCQLRSPAQILWPYLSNTERVNHALGLPAVDYSVWKDADAALKKLATVKFLGIRFTWIEHLFEWSEPRRFSVFREFTVGPFRWVNSTVELLSNGDGTTVIHRFEVAPHGFVGQGLARFQIGRVARRQLRRLYDRIDQVISRRPDLVHSQTSMATDMSDDPFESSPRLSKTSHAAIDSGLDRLAAQGLDSAVLIELSRLIRKGPDQVVGKIRPIVFARDIGLPRKNVIDACLAAVDAGLLSYRWEIHCPSCRVPTSQVERLSDIETHGRCQVCRAEFKNDLAHLVEMTFHVHPTIRSCTNQIYCIGGPWHLPKVSTQCVLPGRQERSLELSLARGRYRLGSPQLRTSIELTIDIEADKRDATVVLSKNRRGEEDVVLSEGSQTITIQNEFAKELVIRIERIDSSEEMFTATEVAALPIFQRLFPNEIPTPENPIEIPELTFVVISRQRGEASRIDSKKRLDQTRQFIRSAGNSISSFNGRYIKNVGETVIAAFHELSDALEVIVNIQRRTAKDEMFRSAVSRGPTVMMNVDDRIEFFADALEEALDLVRVSQENELAMPYELYRREDCVAKWARANNVPRPRLVPTKAKAGIAPDIAVIDLGI